MPKRPTQRNIVIPEQLWSALGEITTATGRDRSELIREAIAAYLKQQTETKGQDR